MVYKTYSHWKSATKRSSLERSSFKRLPHKEWPKDGKPSRILLSSLLSRRIHIRQVKSQWLNSFKLYAMYIKIAI